MDATNVPVPSSNKADWRRVLRVVTPSVRIREQRPGDVAARESLLDASFGLGRFAKACERLREGRLSAEGLSFVAVDAAAVVGTLGLWHVEIGDRASLMLGPLAVSPHRRSFGIGRALIEHALRRARRLGHGSVILVGDACYYGRFGFAAAATEGFVLPGPVERARFLGLELVPGSLKGAGGRIVGAGAFTSDCRDNGGKRLAA